MNNHILSNTRVLLIATMLSAMMLTASSMPSLVSTKAFAQQDIASEVNERVNEVLTQVNPLNSEDEDQQQDASDSDTATAADEQQVEDEEATTTAADEQDASDSEASSTPENRDSQINLDSNSQGETSRVEEDERVTVDPIIQTEVQTGINVNADTALVMDEEDCEDANDEVFQGNGQDSNQQARSEGRVGDNGIYVSPKVQTSEQIAYNVNVDVDLVLVEGCDPSDEVVQANDQSDTQVISSGLEASKDGSTTIIPAEQRSEQRSGNIGVNKDVILPVL
jgi:hypothetical protein